jgi:single-strand DNA-binding protein
MKQNKVQLIGYVGDTPKMKTLTNGVKRLSMRVATHYKLKTGNKPDRYATDWHSVIAWGPRAEYAEVTFVKGSHILVEGSIIYREYTDGLGLLKRLTEVKADGLINLDR